MKSFILLFSIFSFSFLCAQEAPEIEWQVSLGGSNQDEAYSIFQTQDNGYIVAGVTGSNNGDVFCNKGGFNTWVVKMNEEGAIEWSKCFGGSANERINSIVQNSSGEYVFAGTTDSEDGDVTVYHGSSDVWVVKLNQIGDIVWQKSFGGSRDEEGNHIELTNDGGYILAGYTRSIDGDIVENKGLYDFWVLKLDDQGNLEWQKTYGGTEDDKAFAIHQTIDGGYIVGGHSNSNNGDVNGNNGYQDYWVVKLNHIGEITWEKSFGGSENDYLESIEQTSEGGYILAGASSSNDGDVSGNHNYFDYWVLKLTNSGDIEWQKSLGGSRNDWGYSVVQCDNGDYVVAGVTNSIDGDITNHYGSIHDADVWVVKLNINGDLLWEKSFGGFGVEAAHDIIQTTDNGFAIAGLSTFIDGDVSENNGNADFWIVKLGPEQMSTYEIDSTQISIYPNPVKNILNFSEELNDIQIFNLAGQKVFESSDKNKINVSHLNSGIFVLKAKNQKSKSVQLKFIKN